MWRRWRRIAIAPIGMRHCWHFEQVAPMGQKATQMLGARKQDVWGCYSHETVHLDIFDPDPRLRIRKKFQQITWRTFQGTAELFDRREGRVVVQS